MFDRSISLTTFDKDSTSLQIIDVYFFITNLQYDTFRNLLKLYRREGRVIIYN